MSNALTLTKAKDREDYEQLLKLLGTFTRAKHLLAGLEARANQHLTRMASRHAHKFATLQTRATEAHDDAKAIAKRHPEWFPEEQRTIKTLFGSVHAQRTTSHEVPDEAGALAVIDWILAADQSEFELSDGEYDTIEAFIVTKRTLDLEAVGKASDELLARINACAAGTDVVIARVVDDSITVKEAKIKLGDAVKKTTKKKKEVAA